MTQQSAASTPDHPQPRARRARGAVALAGAAVLVGLSAAPAAAAPVSQGSATAVRVTVGGTPTASGTYSAVNDGNGEQTTGNNRPEAGVLGGQQLITTGTLAQDARAQVVDRRGRSAACAGLAGDGASVVAAGEGTCLRGGQNLRLDAASLDFSSLQVVQDGLVPDGVDQPVQDALAPVIGPLTQALNEAVQQGSGALGDPGLFLDLGAVQSSCTAGPGTADGRADIANAAAYVQVGGQRVDLVSLPVDPAPNTKVVADLSGVADTVSAALTSQFEQTVDGALAPLGPVVDQTLGSEILANALDQISGQLAPLQQDVLDITLNKQLRPTRDSIVVTALDASVLPAAQAFGVQALSLQIGESTCGPSGALAPPPAAQPQPAPKAPTARQAPRSAPPVVVTAGAQTADTGSGLGTPGSLALAGLLVLAAGTGLAGFRRSLGR